MNGWTGEEWEKRGQQAVRMVDGGTTILEHDKETCKGRCLRTSKGDVKHFNRKQRHNKEMVSYSLNYYTMLATCAAQSQSRSWPSLGERLTGWMSDWDR